MQELGDDDMASIEETIDDEILHGMDIEFRSTSVQPAADGSRLSVQGDLTLVGQTCPIAFDLLVGAEGELSGRVVLKQSNWGITPYSALFGALQVADEVVIDAVSQPADESDAAAPTRTTRPSSSRASSGGSSSSSTSSSAWSPSACPPIPRCPSRSWRGS